MPVPTEPTKSAARDFTEGVLVLLLGFVLAGAFILRGPVVGSAVLGFVLLAAILWQLSRIVRRLNGRNAP
jgi:hypothetical protein